MKHYLSFALLTCTLLLFGCSDNVPIEEPKFDDLDHYPHDIPLEDALTTLFDFIASEDCPGSRSSVNRADILSTQQIPYTSAPQSRAAGKGDTLDCKTLFYIVNFTGDKGYAVLSADDRIPAPVIALAENGTLSAPRVYESLSEISSMPHFPDYPDNGPGIFTDPDYPGEMFINPNTFNLFIPSEDDGLVGNFDSSELTFTPDQESDGRTNDDDGLIVNLILDYTIRQIEGEDNSNPDDVDRQGDDHRNGQEGPTNPPLTFDNDYSGAGSDAPKLIKTESMYSDWMYRDFVSPILKDKTSWHQGSDTEPYNGMCPKRHQYVVFGKKKRAPVGCLPLAVSKIFAHFKVPEIITYTDNGIRHQVDWSHLNNNILNRYSSPQEWHSVQALTGAVGLGCESWYFYQGTFTFPGKASQFMRNSGYTDAYIHDYDYERVTDSLDDGNPVIIYSIPGVRFWNSHAWIIDGYRVKYRDEYHKHYYDNGDVEFYSGTSTYHYVHCDFGWGGQANGYFISGIFNLKNNLVEYDYGKPNKTYNYNNYIHIITYSNPRK